jgi:AcrR family transcriptional regulator
MENVISKTRDWLVSVAQRLFAQIGIENTTMNDIAVASKKGRRTLYTYFNSKLEIYHAVVESELRILYDSLESVVHQSIPADEKLIEFITVRLDAIRNIVLRNGTLKADFFRDIWRVEHIRKDLDRKEITYIKQILNEGLDGGIFEIDDAESMAAILHHALKGLEVPYIRGLMRGLHPGDKGNRDSIINLLFNGIKKK